MRVGFAMTDRRRLLWGWGGNSASAAFSAAFCASSTTQRDRWTPVTTDGVSDCRTVCVEVLKRPRPAETDNRIRIHELIPYASLLPPPFLLGTTTSRCVRETKQRARHFGWQPAEN
uniref:Secreted protein n=1 Tax=Plectus sambesii TaxID=2011161 RepID=A0A914WTG8_9BILA